MEISVIQHDMVLACNHHVGVLKGLRLSHQPGLGRLTGLEGRQRDRRGLLHQLFKVALENGMHEELAVIHFTDMHDDVVFVCDQYECAVGRLGMLSQPCVRLLSGPEGRHRVRWGLPAELEIILEGVDRAGLRNEHERCGSHLEKIPLFGGWSAPHGPSEQTLHFKDEIVDIHGDTAARCGTTSASADVTSTSGARTTIPAPAETAMNTTPAMTTRLPTMTDFWLRFSQSIALSAEMNS